jgi:hypothetical protein
VITTLHSVYLAQNSTSESELYPTSGDNCNPFRSPPTPRICSLVPNMFPPDIDEYESGKVLAIASHVRRYALPRHAGKLSLTPRSFFLQVVSGYADIPARAVHTRSG